MNIMINYDEFKKVEMRIGKVVEAEKVVPTLRHNVEGTESRHEVVGKKTTKLLKLLVDFGDEKRTIVSGIAEAYEPDDLVGKQLPFVTNLEPRTIFGIESNGMILAAHGEDDMPVLMFPDDNVLNGSEIS